MRKNRRAAGKSGFTLMEVMVALVVLSITLLGVYQGLSSTLTINQLTQELWRAILFTNNELARAERNPAGAVSISQGDYPADHSLAVFEWKREISDEEPFPGVQVRKVSFELFWKTAGRKQHYRSQTYVPAN